MVILDTDHVSLVQFRESAPATRLIARLATIDSEQIATTIVTYEEQTRGWLAQIARAKDLPQEIEAYRRLNRNLDGFRTIRVLDFDAPAAAELRRFRPGSSATGPG